MGVLLMTAVAEFGLVSAADAIGRFGGLRNYDGAHAVKAGSLRGKR